MSRYETYKQSGIDWIGEVPAHFVLTRFKNDFGYIKGKNPKETFFLDEANGRNTDMPYLSMEYLRNENAEPEFPEFDTKLVSVEEGQSLLLWDGSNAGEFIKSKQGYLSSTMVRIDHSNNINRKYAFYIFQCYERILRDFTNGMGIPHVNGVLLINTYLPITLDKSEQLTIANYLDTQTQIIDRLIANKKAQAEKLKELRQIEINNAVTKGLNPKAEMKESGIEWLGKIPKAWEVKRLKNLANQISEKSSEILDDDFLVALENIESHTGKFNETASEYENNGIKFKKGNILYNKLRPYLNKVFLADRDGICVGDIIVIECTPKLYPAFLQFRMLSDSFCSIIMSSVYGAKMPRTSWQFISSLKIAYPSYEEQVQIAEHLNKRTIAIEGLIQNINQQIEKLQELRKIKIYEAVTGKIKVTGDEQKN
jgi:type I restriction enzyme S subunit